MVEAIIIYSLAINAPIGYVKINDSICKKIYNLNFDGKLVRPNGNYVLVKANCYKKDITNG